MSGKIEQHFDVFDCPTCHGCGAPYEYTSPRPHVIRLPWWPKVEVRIEDTYQVLCPTIGCEVDYEWAQGPESEHDRYLTQLMGDTLVLAGHDALRTGTVPRELWSRVQAVQAMKGLGYTWNGNQWVDGTGTGVAPNQQRELWKLRPEQEAPE